MWKPLEQLIRSVRHSGRDDAPGLWGEKQAEAFLIKKGYRILGRRLRIGRRDELDLVARDGEILVFVEVKTRRTEDFGRPISSVRRKKKHSLSRAAVRYLKRLHPPAKYFRFDVVEVVGASDSPQTELNHIINAFPLDRCYRPPV